MVTPSELLDKYQSAAEALNDALITLAARIHSTNRGERERLRDLVERCQADLDQARLEFERGAADLDQSTRNDHI